MKRARPIGMVCALCVPLLAAIGCNDPKDDELAALRQENARLTDELSATRMNSDANLADADTARRRYEDAQREIADLRALAEKTPPQGEGWQSVPGGARITLASGILFDSGKTRIKSSARPILDRVASDIAGQYADKEIFVFGHTDDRPIVKSGWKDNFELSSQRALAIVRYLQKQGIPGSRLVAAGCGEHRPNQPNTSTPNRAKNRRVEIYAINSGS